MGKLFSWVLMGLVGYLAWRLMGVVARKPVAGRAGGVARSGEAPRARELMVRCETCGTHVPASEAVDAGGHHYCCSAHRDAGA